MTINQALEYFGAFAAICGIVSNVLPQHWRVTKILTKLGALSFRAQTAPKEYKP